VFVALCGASVFAIAVERIRKCPKCARGWALSEPFHGKFDFLCEHCRFISNIAFDVR
jgi:predicted  nucleic acid-binding Zn ribbon protein